MKSLIKILLITLSLLSIKVLAEAPGPDKESKSAEKEQAFENPIVGEVFYTRGKVLLTRDNKAFQLPNQPNAIRKNDKIKTYKGAIAIIAFGPEKESKMKIDQDSEVVIDELMKGSKKADPKQGNFKNTVSILKGSLNVIFNKNKVESNELNVKTRYATFGIRGTEFFVHDGFNGASFLAVKDGVVAAIQKGPKNKDVESLLSKDTAMILTPYLERVRQELPEWMGLINWKMDPREYLPQSEELYQKMEASYKSGVKNQAPEPQKVKGFDDLAKELDGAGAGGGSTKSK